MKPRQSPPTQPNHALASKQPRPWILAVMLTGLIALNAYPSLIQLILTQTTVLLKSTFLSHSSIALESNPKVSLTSVLPESPAQSPRTDCTSHSDCVSDSVVMYQLLPSLSYFPHLSINDMMLSEPQFMGLSLDLAQQQLSNPQNPLPNSVVKLIRQDVAKILGTAPEQFNLIQATPQNWPDTCLGLAQAGEFCGQQMLSGWRVVVSDGGQTWVYRTDATGKLLRLESGHRSLSPKQRLRSLTVLSPD